MKRHHIYLAMLVLAALAAMALSACQGESKLEKQAHAQEVATEVAAEKEIVPANVKVLAIEPQSMTEELVVVGDTVADMDVRISAETPGRIEYLSFEVGDTVKKGQTLARIDYQMLKAQADQAEANFDLADKTFKRLKTLRDEELVSQQQIDEANAQRVAAQAQLEIAKVNLSKSLVRSPTTGMVVEKGVEVGEYVGPGTPLLRIVDTDPIYVLSDIPESAVASVEKGMPATVRIDVLGAEVAGRIDYVLPVSNAVSKTYRIRIKLDGDNPQVRAGMATTVIVRTRTHADAIVIPQEAVVEEGDNEYVYVIQAGKAVQRTAELGPTSGNTVLVKDGLAAGESLVIVGQRDLVNGQPVKIIQN